MNPETFTHRTNEALAGALELAISSGHVTLNPLHLASTLISDPNGIFFQAISNVGGQESARAVE